MFCWVGRWEDRLEDEVEAEEEGRRSFGYDEEIRQRNCLPLVFSRLIEV